MFEMIFMLIRKFNEKNQMIQEFMILKMIREFNDFEDDSKIQRKKNQTDVSQ